MDTVITVKEVMGRCPVYAVGDSFRLLKGYQLVADKPVCMHALASLMPFYNALRLAEPGRFGLADRDEPTQAVIQCPDPCAHTGGGTVIFRIAQAQGE